MKVAVFRSLNEVIILPIKGMARSAESVDGFNVWFGSEPENRNVEDFDVTLCHIGAGSAVYISTKIKTDWLCGETDILDWFIEEDDEDNN